MNWQSLAEWFTMKQLLSVRARRRDRKRSERGAVTFLVAITVLILMLAGAIAVDLSATATRGQSLQNAVDSAALAGVQAFRQSMGSDLVADQADEDAAIAAVNALLTQNGIEGLTAEVTFPDQTNFTEVRVSLRDPDTGLLLSGFTKIGGEVERNATARFEACQDGCVQDILIPPPFKGVDATGDGDGYKPIPVRNRLYSINHNSGLQSNGQTRGNRQITCVDRITEDHCWEEGPARPAYPAGFVPDATPEMPHAGVWDNVIYWVSSTQNGTYLFCFDTNSDTPCSTPYLLNNRARLPFSVVNSSRIQHRGGGAFEWGGLIYAFTDDHRVHCIEPGLPLTPCPAYGALGLEHSLAQFNFPANGPDERNHGSSIDRVIDRQGSRVYATTHIDNTAYSGFRVTNPNESIGPDDVDCRAPLSDPVGDDVVIRNAATGRYIEALGPRTFSLSVNSDAHILYSRWKIIDNGDGQVNIQSATNWNNLRVRQTNSFSSLVSPTSASSQLWQLNNFDPAANTLEIEAGFGLGGNRIADYSSNGTIDVAELSWDDSDTRAEFQWEFWPYECAIDDLDWEARPTPGLNYSEGTWIHCWDLASATSCPGFTPSKLHNDWDSFSGRLFFHRTARPFSLIDGVCSTGFTRQWRWTNMQDATELTCVSPSDGLSADGIESSMQTFTTQLAAANTGGSGWGTWGDPHYNEFTNRLFYPTHRIFSRVLCWDFNAGSACPAVQGYSDDEESFIQDYGFTSDRNCVFGLGHIAVFWAFEADNPGEECKGSSRTEPLTPCNCGGDWFWGTIDFDVDLAGFDEFFVSIKNAAGERVYPPVPAGDDPRFPQDPDHSLHDDGTTIPLDEFLDADPSAELFITLAVETDSDPWALGDQIVSVQFEVQPRLVD